MCYPKFRQQSSKKIAEEIWLQYFNNYLYGRGIITEAEKIKMQNLIYSAYGKTEPWK